MTDADTNRRLFLKSMGLLAAGGALAPRAAESAEFPLSTSGPPADLPRELALNQADLGTNFQFVEQLAQGNEYRDSFLTRDYESLEAFKTAGRERVFETLLYRPEAVDPQSEVLNRDDCGEFVRERVLFNTAPGFRIPAYVHIPKGLKEPAPAIVDLHSHGGMFLFGKEKVIDFGRNHPAMTRYHERNYDGRPTATEFVKRGYVVITIDAFMFGERRVMVDADLKYGWDRSKYDEDAVNELNARCRGKESTIVKSLIFAGLTWPGIVFWDDIRTVDYLVTRPDVDPKRIGCVGISMGGYRSLYLAGLDERIAAACVVGFMSKVQPMLRNKIDTHSFVHFVPALHRFLDLPDVVSMMAPKPLLVQQCSQDGLFTLEGMQASIEKIAAVYRKAGAGRQFGGRFYDNPHKYTLPMQDEAFAWFDAQLKP